MLLVVLAGVVVVDELLLVLEVLDEDLVEDVFVVVVVEVLLVLVVVVVLVVVGVVVCGLGTGCGMASAPARKVARSKEVISMVTPQKSWWMRHSMSLQSRYLCLQLDERLVSQELLFL